MGIGDFMERKLWAGHWLTLKGIKLSIGETHVFQMQKRQGMVSKENKIISSHLPPYYGFHVSMKVFSSVAPNLSVLHIG